MHRLMLQDGEDPLAAMHDTVRLPVDRRGGERRQDRRVRPRDVALHRLARRPGIAGRRRGGGTVGRIDAAREKRFQLAIDPGVSEPPLQQRVDREGGDVAVVEDHRVPELDRVRVVRLWR